ncbi:MAG: SDR family NAD(P)-dependent oxidoreductase, partial [Gemmatimonadetes bacterium]|nr:SDR family NAD(P)-dependent oxidoreductase [Gemmatimonadota bacterium]
IDTVKQAEMFAAIRERWGIERDENLQLRDYPTLEHVAGFVRERLPEASVPSASPADAPAAELAATAPAATATPTMQAPETGAAAVETTAPAGTPADATDIEATILEIVAEKTGYPTDMLDVELDLEADLGIDTVKQAEMFAAIRERWGIERDENLQLRDYPTLQHVAGFVRDRLPSGTDSAPSEAGSPERMPDGTPASDMRVESPWAPPSAASAPAVDEGRPIPGTFAQLRGDDAAAAALPRRVAGLTLLPHRERFERSTAGPWAGSVVAIVPDAAGVSVELKARLGGRAVRAIVLSRDEPGTWEATLRPFLEQGALRGVYWLPALDPDPDAASTDLEGWRAATALRVKALHRLVRILGPDFDGDQRFLLAGTRMGGAFGYDGGASNPLGGAVSGFVKALARERPSLMCKVVDVGDVDSRAVARDLLDESLFDRSTVEVGLQDGRRWGVTVTEVPLGTDETGVDLHADSVFLVTGAAGSIVAAGVGELARQAGGGHFHLLDLAPAPDADDPEVMRVSSDRDGLKRDIFQRLSASGQRVTPVQVERELARLERAEAALAAIRMVEAAGGSATYHSVNLLEAEGVDSVVADVVGRHGRVDVLVHAAGLEVSRRIEDKPDEEFDRVFDVKADGWFNLHRALGSTPLGAAVVFSSVAGRFGNAGQTDYSAANDFLVKATSALSGTRGARGLAVDWTAWRDIGMASRGSIPQMMAAAGIDMLPPEAGLPVVGRELRLDSGFREIVVGLELGRLLEGPGGPEGSSVRSPAGFRPGPMTSGAAFYDTYRGLTVETRLDPAIQPFLDDHRIEGTPVLPGVMGIEGFAELAGLLAPEWTVVSVDDVGFHAPFKFYRDEARVVRLEGVALRDGDELVVRARLIGVRHLERLDEDRETIHFSGTVRLAPPGAVAGAEQSTPLDARLSEALRSGAPADPVNGVADREAVYRVYFHGPTYQVLGGAWASGAASAVGRMATRLQADVEPANAPMLLPPRWIELCFQTAGVLELADDPHLRLPAGLAGIRLLAGNGAWNGADPVHAVVQRRPDGAFDAEVVDGRGRPLLRVEGYRTVAAPDTVDAARLAVLRSGFRGS